MLLATAALHAAATDAVAMLPQAAGHQPSLWAYLTMQREVTNEKCDLVKSHCSSGCHALSETRQPVCSGATIAPEDWLDIDRFWSCSNPMCDYEDRHISDYGEPECYLMGDGSHFVWCPSCKGGFCLTPPAEVQLVVGVLITLGFFFACVVTGRVRNRWRAPDQQTDLTTPDGGRQARGASESRSVAEMTSRQAGLTDQHASWSASASKSHGAELTDQHARPAMTSKTWMTSAETEMLT